MSNYYLILSIIWLTCHLPGSIRGQNISEAYEILIEAELKRAPWLEMEIQAELFGIDKKGKERFSEFRVFFKDSTKTIAGMVKPVFEKGNLLLMVGEDLWFYVRETRRPTRITPIQRLSGAVSYGDLARLSWTLDYKIESIESDLLEDSNLETHKLILQAKTGGATYQKVHLWIDKKTSRPVLSDVFLLSGKHFKTIEFTKFEIKHGKEVNTEIQYTDHLRKGLTTTLRFTDVQPKPSIPDKYFIKTYLPDLSTEIIE